MGEVIPFRTAPVIRVDRSGEEWLVTVSEHPTRVRCSCALEAADVATEISERNGWRIRPEDFDLRKVFGGAA